MIDNCGLSKSDQETIENVMQSFEEIEEVLLYGSRAKGNYKIGSDIDLAIKGKAVTDKLCSRLHSLLNEETPLPYFFDVTNYEHLNHQALKDHIDRVGKQFYQRTNISR